MIRLLATLTLSAIALFAFFPELDLAVSRSFFDPETAKFPYGEALLVNIFHYGIYVLALVILGTTGLMLAGYYGKQYIPILGRIPCPDHRVVLFLMLAFMLGPVLLVHQGFKEVWGRERPVDIQEFGGEKSYSSMFEIHPERDGTSFVSGHSAVGFYMMIFAFIVGTKKRVAYAIAGGVFGTIAAFARIAEGKHFLSDTIFGALVTLWVITVLYDLLLKRPPTPKT